MDLKVFFHRFFMNLHQIKSFYFLLYSSYKLVLNWFGFGTDKYKQKSSISRFCTKKIILCKFIDHANMHRLHACIIQKSYKQLYMKSIYSCSLFLRIMHACKPVQPKCSFIKNAAPFINFVFILLF